MLWLSRNGRFPQRALVVGQQKLGKTVSYIALGDRLAGFVVIHDAIKASSRQAIAGLIDRRIEVIMMTGNNANMAAAVAGEFQLSDFQAGG